MIIINICEYLWSLNFNIVCPSDFYAMLLNNQQLRLKLCQLCLFTNKALIYRLLKILPFQLNTYILYERLSMDRKFPSAKYPTTTKWTVEKTTVTFMKNKCLSPTGEYSKDEYSITEKFHFSDMSQKMTFQKWWKFFWHLNDTLFSALETFVYTTYIYIYRPNLRK